MSVYEAKGDRERKTAIAADPLAQIIHDTINAKPHAMRLYPDLYAIEVADTVRSYLSAQQPPRRQSLWPRIARTWGVLIGTKRGRAHE